MFQSLFIYKVSNYNKKDLETMIMNLSFLKSLKFDLDKIYVVKN